MKINFNLIFTLAVAAILLYSGHAGRLHYFSYAYDVLACGQFLT